MGLFSFLSKGEKTMKMTTLEQDVKSLKKRMRSSKKKRLDRDELYIEKIITQLDRLMDFVKMMVERR